MGNPFGLVNLFDMLQIDGPKFYAASMLMGMLHEEFYSKKQSDNLTDADGQEAIDTLKKLEGVLAELGANFTGMAAGFLIERISDTDGLSYNSYRTYSLGIIQRFADELGDIYLFAVDGNRKDLFSQLSPLFGDTVSNVFAGMSEDISEAGKCLALKRPTACVFHLMRVMELGVQRLGAKMDTEINIKTETWYQIIIHVQKKISDIADKDKKARYAVVAGHLNMVRIAWRNGVMHPKATYTDEQAFEVYQAVRAFIRDLAELV